MKKSSSTEIRSKRIPFISNKRPGFCLIFERPHAVRRFLIAFFMIWFGMLLIYGITSNIMNEFYQFIFFLRHPVIIMLNGAALVAASVHTFYWFSGDREGGICASFPLCRKKSQGWAGIFLVAIITVFLLWMI